MDKYKVARMTDDELKQYLSDHDIPHEMPRRRGQTAAQQTKRLYMQVRVRNQMLKEKEKK